MELWGAGRPSPGWGAKEAGTAKDTRREVARLAHDRGEGRPLKRRRLLVDDADEAVPTELLGYSVCWSGGPASPFFPGGAWPRGAWPPPTPLSPTNPTPLHRSIPRH